MLYSDREWEYGLYHPKNWFSSNEKARMISNYTLSETWSFKTSMHQTPFSVTVKERKKTGNFQYIAVCKIPGSLYLSRNCLGKWRSCLIAGGLAGWAQIFRDAKSIKHSDWFILVDLDNINLRQHLTNVLRS